VQRKPDLIVLAFGTNEAADADWTFAEYRQLLAGILRRLHATAPRASILIYGPPDRADLPLAAKRMPGVIEAERRAAFEGNAAFWSSYDAMGGPGSMKAWVARGLGQADRVHFTSAGYVRLADLFYQDLMRASAVSRFEFRVRSLVSRLPISEKVDCASDLADLNSKPETRNSKLPPVCGKPHRPSVIRRNCGLRLSFTYTVASHLTQFPVLVRMAIETSYDAR